MLMDTVRKYLSLLRPVMPTTQNQTEATAITANNVIVMNSTVGAAAGGVSASCTNGAKPKSMNCKESKKEESPDCPPLWNDVWIDTQTADIASVVCKSDEALKEVEDFFQDSHRRIIRLPREVFTQIGGVVKMKLTCTTPPDMTVDPTDESLDITKETFSRKWEQFDFELSRTTPSSSDRCRVLYNIKSLDCNNHEIDRFSCKPHFPWPTTSETCKTGKHDERPGDSCEKFNVQNITAGEDVFFGGRNHDVDRSYKGQVKEIKRNTTSSESETSVYDDKILIADLEGSLDKGSIKAKIFGPEENFLEHGRCGITVQPGLIEGSKEVVISLTDEAEGFPESGVAITQVLRKSCKFDHPITVKLLSSVTAKQGETLQIDIMMKSGGSEWKKIQQGTIKQDNVIEFKTMKSCSYVVLLSKDQEMNAEVHLFFDVWLHKKTGTIVCFFLKYESSLANVVEVLKREHRRILPLPREIIVGIGSTIRVEIKSRSHPNFQMKTSEGDEGCIKIDSNIARKRFYTMIFHPSPPVESSDGQERYRFTCLVDIFDPSGNSLDGGFKTPIHFLWPQELSGDMNSGLIGERSEISQINVKKPETGESKVIQSSDGATSRLIGEKVKISQINVKGPRRNLIMYRPFDLESFRASPTERPSINIEERSSIKLATQAPCSAELCNVSDHAALQHPEGTPGILYSVIEWVAEKTGFAYYLQPSLKPYLLYAEKYGNFKFFAGIEGHEVESEITKECKSRGYRSILVKPVAVRVKRWTNEIVFMKLECFDPQTKAFELVHRYEFNSAAVLRHTFLRCNFSLRNVPAGSKEEFITVRLTFDKLQPDRKLEPTTTTVRKPHNTEKIEAIATGPENEMINVTAVPAGRQAGWNFLRFLAYAKPAVLQTPEATAITGNNVIVINSTVGAAAGGVSAYGAKPNSMNCKESKKESQEHRVNIAVAPSVTAGHCNDLPTLEVTECEDEELKL